MKALLLGVALVFVTGEAWAHPGCRADQTPGRYCAETSHDHTRVSERGGCRNPDTTLIIGGPAVSGTLIAHHDDPWDTPRLMYSYRVIGGVPDLATNPYYLGKFHVAVTGDGVYLHTRGIRGFFTPFLFEDGDHLSIVLKKEGARWMLSDEAHTYMHLTYDIDERDLHSGTRQKIVANALSTFRVEDRDGELTLDVPDERYGDALYSFVQALLKIANTANLLRG